MDHPDNNSAEDLPISGASESRFTELAQLISHFLDARFPPSNDPGLKNAIRLPAFVAHILQETQPEPCVIFSALLLAERFKHCDLMKISFVSGHRVFISAFRLAWKFLYDNRLQSASCWQALAQQQNLSSEDILWMELEFCRRLDWDIALSDNLQLTDFEKKVRFDFCNGGAAPFPHYPPESTSHRGRKDIVNSAWTKSSTV
ncbi:hypothetical protein C8J56DRAFT_1068605 [Mycena floridula]|nr:hypothetical protein C8J56DRAFT_1068605 [Mycena floridula]